MQVPKGETDTGKIEILETFQGGVGETHALFNTYFHDCVFFF
jgi:hypothetical protein